MLNHYRVLDFTDERGEMGPMLLGDLGADVIKVEPVAGCRSRRCPPFYKTENGDSISLSFQSFNRNKRSIVLDHSSAADRETLTGLIKVSDIIFVSAPAGIAEDFGIDFEAAKKINPLIVFVNISAFGASGPNAALHANDLSIVAMGGPVSLQGPLERQPVRISVPQVWRHAGAEGAAGALVALTKAHRCGQGQFVDLSAQSVMTWTMLNGMDAFAIQGFEFERGGGSIRNGDLKMEIVHPTADGYVVAIPQGVVLAGCTEWMIADGVADESLREMDWQQYDLNIQDIDSKPMNLPQGTELLRKFLIKHSKESLMTYGLEKGITLAPVNTLQELLALEHMHTRDYWRDLSIEDSGTVKTPGLWAKPDIGGLSVNREAPKLDEHGQQIKASLNAAELTVSSASSFETCDDNLPFEGVTVADFAWVGVGPISSKYLADHGANVIRVESELRPDVLRANAPYKDAEPGWNRSQFFGDFNTSKRSLALDMKTPKAIEIAKRLIAQSDVLIESFAPGAITRMGLGYDEVKKLNPAIIMISTCLMGQTGPAATMAGYGYHAAAMAGFYEVTGWPDQRPLGPWIAYTDTIAPRFVSILLAAALDRRRRTGKGCYIDVAQIETALHFLAPELLDSQINDRHATRMGNRSSYAAPQGCYPCTGEDRWCAISIETDAEWMRLCDAIGREDWAANHAMSTNEQRISLHDEIDEGLADWTSHRSSREVMNTLQNAGIAAGVVQNSADLLADVQYKHRDFYRYYDHPEMGTIPYAGHQYRISGYDNSPRGPAPCLGEHSFEVLSEVVGLSDDEIATAYADGIII